MHFTTRMSYIVEIDEDLYDLFDDPTLANSSNNIFVQLSFRRKIQRYRGGGGCLNSLAPIIPESYEKSISLDDACSNYPSHGKNPLSPLLLNAEIPENNVFDLLTLVNYRAKCYLKQQQQQQEEDRFYGGHGYDTYGRLPRMVPIRIDIEICRREYYGKLENIAGDISASTMAALETVSTVSIRLDADNHHGSECIICLEKISATDYRQISRIPCSHLFHTDCILRWLTKSFTCPTCRFQMPFEECLY